LSRSLKIVLLILAVILILYIASEIIIPIGASWYIRREIQKRYPEAADVSVSVRAFPAFMLLARKYSSLTIEARRIKLNGINFDSIKLFSSTYPRGTFNAVIGRDEINNFFSVAGSYLKNPQVTVEDSRLRIKGQVDLGYGPLNASGTGTLVPRNGHDVYLVPDEVTVEGTSLGSQTEGAVREYLRDNPVFIVRSDLPFTITAIRAGNGKLTLIGDVDMEKALKFK
jgi:hypothetical protein